MKVLHVFSGNKKNGICPIVKAQGDSLKEFGVEIDYFGIVGHGISGYLKNIPRLRQKIRLGDFDLVHSHYSLSAIVATLAGASPLAVSLMGCSIGKPLKKYIIHILNKLFWNACIVKSKRMYDVLGCPEALIIPNGVNLDVFKPFNKQEAIKHLGWNPNKTHILCAANPNRPEKNTALAVDAFDLLKRDDMELHFLIDVPHNEIPYHYNASDLVILTSTSEGSPNVIKEALACNCKIVSTDVGDVAERFQNSSFCSIATNDASDFAKKMELALQLEHAPNTRDLVVDLDSKIVAQRLIDIYNSIIVR